MIRTGVLPGNVRVCECRPSRLRVLWKEPLVMIAIGASQTHSLPPTMACARFTYLDHRLRPDFGR